MAEYNEIEPSDVVDYSVIFTNPELEWTWSYEYPEYANTNYLVMTQQLIDNL